MDHIKNINPMDSTHTDDSPLSPSSSSTTSSESSDGSMITVDLSNNLPGDIEIVLEQGDIKIYQSTLGTVLENRGSRPLAAAITKQNPSITKLNDFKKRTHEQMIDNLQNDNKNKIPKETEDNSTMIIPIRRSESLEYIIELKQLQEEKETEDLEDEDIQVI